MQKLVKNVKTRPNIVSNDLNKVYESEKELRAKIEKILPEGKSEGGSSFSFRKMSEENFKMSEENFKIPHLVRKKSPLLEKIIRRSPEIEIVNEKRRSPEIEIVNRRSPEIEIMSGKMNSNSSTTPTDSSLLANSLENLEISPRFQKNEINLLHTHNPAHNQNVQMNNFVPKDGFHAVAFPNGNQYQGEWREGTFEGKGSLRLVNGSVYQGEFHKGKFHGEGTFYFPDGTFYMGGWAEGVRNGKGQQKYNDGAVYTGTWKDDMRHGYGVLMLPDGTSFMGEFREDKMEGKGRFSFTTGTTFGGEWKGGKRTGEGILERFDGTMQKQVYDGDVLVQAGESILQEEEIKTQKQQFLTQLLSSIAQLDRKSLVISEKQVTKKFFSVHSFPNFKKKKQLGEGYYGVVVYGTYEGKPVAIKKLKSNIPENVLAKFVHEVNMLSRIDHPNIVKYIGAVMQPDLFCIVTEFMNAGTLWEYIHNNQFHFTEGIILKVSLDICAAMEYLHALKPMVIHR